MAPILSGLSLPYWMRGVPVIDIFALAGVLLALHLGISAAKVRFKLREILGSVALVTMVGILLDQLGWRFAGMNQSDENPIAIYVVKSGWIIALSWITSSVLSIYARKS